MYLHQINITYLVNWCDYQQRPIITLTSNCAYSHYWPILLAYSNDIVYYLVLILATSYIFICIQLLFFQLLMHINYIPSVHNS